MLNKDDIEKLHGVMLPDSENWKEQSLISSTPAGKAEMTRTEAFHNRALNGDEDCAGWQRECERLREALQRIADDYAEHAKRHPEDIPAKSIRDGIAALKEGSAK